MIRHESSHSASQRLGRLASAFLLLTALLQAAPATAAHAYAQFGDIKYPAGFKHFEWVNPDAPRGGSVTLITTSTSSNFDKYNPYTLKGTAPPGLSGEPLLFESLLTGSLDEPTTAYGLLAEDVSMAPDQLSATFRLNPLARFQDGTPVLAADVKHSFDMLSGPKAHPAYRAAFSDVKRAVVLDERTVRFDFNVASAALPLLVGGMPVFSRNWGKGKAFDEIIMDKPIGSGPYRIGRVDFGRDISYERDPKYWARDLNTRRGMFNFDHITYKIYKDDTAQTEAFKAGEFDFIQVFVSRQWARTYKGAKFDSGEIIKRLLPNRNAGDFQGMQINSRREKFKDPRVREALGLALDFEWMNRMLFYNSYTHMRGYFPGGDFEASGLPTGDELALLESLRGKLPAKIFTQPVPLPPSTNPPGSLRANLRKARELLAEAGWTYRDGALRNAKGEAFTIEFVDSQTQGASGARIITPLMKNLEKLGIEANHRLVDTALLQKRTDVFDFDILTTRVPGVEAPGIELRDRFGSQAAKTEGSSNIAGISDPAVDALVDKAIAARTRPQLISALRAIDRVLRFGHYTIPQWYQSRFRVAWHNHRFGQPSVMPSYYQPEGWLVSTWWALPTSAASEVK
ncbi:MAG TPA: extracellular solute-binding protein [Rhodocyclaceae bacterium]|nr:extracellular solute-binding protein [Rhodocyclaceae bacterium]